jgi:hypothetical protein
MDSLEDKHLLDAILEDMERMVDEIKSAMKKQETPLSN